MWIFLGILAFLMVLIAVVLLLPIRIILKTDEHGSWLFRYAVLWKTFGGEPKSTKNNRIANLLKKLTGIGRLETDTLKQRVSDGDLLTIVNDSISVIVDLLGRVVELLKVGVLKTLHITIVCATGDAATTAIRYGACYTAISPLLALLHSNIKIKRSGERICITPDFTAEQDSYACEIVISIRVFQTLLTLRRVLRDEKLRKTATSQNLDNQ